jgi:dCTP deaminase
MGESDPKSGFWSGETLLKRLPELIRPFAPDHVECASYELTIGHEIYVSPSDQTPDPQSVTKRLLADGEAFTIPPGQFAFLMTEETVKVPTDALGLISMKAKIKFRGLVNISGFHVDPGYDGQLTYSVFNAGPVTVQLQQGEPCFLIWYASLDQPSTYVKKDPPRKGLDVGLINNISAEVHSLKGLDNKIKDLEKSLGERIHSVEVSQAYFNAITSVGVPFLTALITGIIVWWVTSAASCNRLTEPSTLQNTTAPAAVSTITEGERAPVGLLAPSAIPTSPKGQTPQ